jgi:hypothetical protein
VCIYIYTTLKFLALQGAPYIYNISRLRVNNISKTAFLESTKKLKERANKCNDQGGIYFEE